MTYMLCDRIKKIKTIRSRYPEITCFIRNNAIDIIAGKTLFLVEVFSVAISAFDTKTANRPFALTSPITVLKAALGLCPSRQPT